MAQTLDQKRAALAWGYATASRNLQGEMADKYRNLAKGAGRGCGDNLGGGDFLHSHPGAGLHHHRNVLCAMSETPKIRLRGLSKAFGAKQVLDGVDLDIRARHGMVILGGSGSGKSVTIKCILGLIEPDAGSIEIDGQDILKLPRRDREALNDRIGMLFQNGALFDSLPVWENVCFKLLAQKRITRARARDKAAEVLALVGLAASVGDLSPSELSGGMQKRVALARAIAAEPEIIFFDEPTTGLDPIMGAVIDGLIVDVVQRLGATAVSITHDMASARRIGDDAAMIHKGRIIWTGQAARLGETGNAMVDQFARGEREGPIQMELRK